MKVDKKKMVPTEEVELVEVTSPDFERRGFFKQL